MSGTYKLSTQDIFDRVAVHLLVQKKKSILTKEQIIAFSRWDNTCAYRGKNGLKCAVGALISDAEYQLLTEQQRADTIQEYFGRFSELPYGFLSEMQQIHDNNKPSRWLEKLSAFATKHKLDKSVLNQFRKPKKAKK